MKCAILFVILCAVIVGTPNVGHAADLKVVLLDSKTGLPLRGKSMCISFHPDPRGSGYDKADRCAKTDRNGVLTITGSNQALEVVQVWTLTNDLLSCFAPGQQFSIADVFSTGVIARNTCGDASRKPTAEPGNLMLFAHQMTFGEVLKSMGREL